MTKYALTDRGFDRIMTGLELSLIRNKLGLTRLQWGRALGYRGTDESIGVMVRRTETMDAVPGQIERLAEMYERHGVPAEYTG